MRNDKLRSFYLTFFISLIHVYYGWVLSRQGNLYWTLPSALCLLWLLCSSGPVSGSWNVPVFRLLRQLDYQAAVHVHGADRAGHARGGPADRLRHLQVDHVSNDWCMESQWGKRVCMLYHWRWQTLERLLWTRLIKLNDYFTHTQKNRTTKTIKQQKKTFSLRMIVGFFCESSGNVSEVFVVTWLIICIILHYWFEAKNIRTRNLRNCRIRWQIIMLFTICIYIFRSPVGRYIATSRVLPKHFGKFRKVSAAYVARSRLSVRIKPHMLHNLIISPKQIPQASSSRSLFYHYWQRQRKDLNNYATHGQTLFLLLVYCSIHKFKIMSYFVDKY